MRLMDKGLAPAIAANRFGLGARPASWTPSGLRARLAAIAAAAAGTLKKRGQLVRTADLCQSPGAAALRGGAPWTTSNTAAP